MTTGQSTPSVTPPATSAPAEVSTTVKELVARGATIEEFCINVARTLLGQGQFIDTKSGAKNPTAYAKFNLGDGPSDFRKSLALKYEEAKHLNTISGMPMAISFSMALLDLTPAGKWVGHNAERKAATATRDANSAARISDDALLQELQRRGIEVK